MKRVSTTTAVLGLVSLIGLWLLILGTVGAVVLAIFWDGLWWISAATALGGLFIVFVSEAALEEIDPMDSGWP